ncbi:MAG TPA: TonB-dependent receptor, partial [Gemmatimonadaceae bacterium]|nr:TonB-dependent receptor [Gemmatimonadaceae bacterium]
SLVIVRGLSSLLNGPNTLGGTIEVSHEDAFGRLGTGRVWGGVGVDENAAYVASIGGGRDFGDGATGVSVRGGFAHRQRDGFTLATGAVDPTASDGLRTNSDLLETDAFGAVRWTGAAGRSAGLIVSGFNAERGVPPEEHIAEPRLWRYPFHSRAIAALSASAGTFATPAGHGTFDIGAGYNSGRLRIDTYDDRTYSSIATSESGDERTWTGRARFTHTLPAGARLKTAATTAIINYDEALPATPVAEYQQRLWSAGAEVEIPVAQTQFSGGLVFDRSTSPLTGGRTPGQPPFDDIGWRAGATHDLNATTRLHASASQRSRFPALRELYSGALNRFVPNPSLRPEQLLGLEAGVTIDRSIGVIPDATFQVNGFHHTLNDAVVRITLPDPDRRFQRINRDRIESYGAELLAGIALGSNRDRAITVTGDALIQRIRVFDQTDANALRHPENNPETRGMLEIGVPLVARVRGFANARYTGRQYCLNSDTGDEMRLDAQTETNLALERRFRLSGGGAVRGFRALLALDNVGNAAIYDQCGLPQPGRTLRAMITIQ